MKSSSTEPTTSDTNPPTEKPNLKRRLGKQVNIKLGSKGVNHDTDRYLSGILSGFDENGNIVLDDCIEHLSNGLCENVGNEVVLRGGKYTILEAPNSERNFEFVGVIIGQSKVKKTMKFNNCPEPFVIEKNCVDFLVYSFEKHRFVYSIPVLAHRLPNEKPGTWLRIATRAFDFDEMRRKRRFIDHLQKAVFCQRRIVTRCFDGKVNFTVLATRDRNTTSPSPNKITYECQLGKLYIQKDQLKDPDPELFIGDGEATSSDDEDFPEQLRIWCHPCMEHDGGDFYDDQIFELTRIEERYYAEHVDSDCGEGGEEAGKGGGWDFPNHPIPMVNGCCNGALPELLQNGCALVASTPPKLSARFSDWLSQLILRNYEANRFSAERRTKMDEFVEDLETIIRLELYIPEIRLKVFGSINSGFGSDESDLDLCVVDLRKMNFDDPIKCTNRRRFLLTKLEEHLRMEPDFDGVEAVLDARTPICKFENRRTGFHGDISIENRLALYNTELLKLYTEFDERVAPLGFAIKRWAKLLGLNDASTGSISSYAYIVMLISFLQRTQPPVLPFLQELPKDEKLPTGLVEGCRVAYSTDLASIRAQPQFCNRQSLGELFRDFLRHFGRKFSILEDVAQIRTSGEYGKRERSPDEPLKHRLCVEDPFDLDHNLTSGVREETLDHILKCMRATQQGLEKFDKDHFGPQTAGQPGESTKSSSEHSSREELPPELIGMDFSKLMVMFKKRRVIQMPKK